MKPQAKTVPSDDCVVTIDSVDYPLHEGESVTVVPGFSVGDIQLMRQLAELQPKVDAAEGGIEKVGITDDVIAGTVTALSRRVLAWTWTDDAGRLLPQPLGNPAAFATLRIEELMYLALIVRGESPGERKNGSRPSPTSSSAIRTSRRRAAKA